MPGVIAKPVQTGTEPSFLLDWNQLQDQSYRKPAALSSAGLHVLFALFLLFAPSSRPPVHHTERPAARRRVTPLVDPPTQLTQKAPNTEKPSKSINLDSLRLPTPKPTPPVVAKKVPDKIAPRTMQPPPAAPAVVAQQPKNTPEPPKLEAAAPQTDKSAGILNNIAPVQVAQQPKLVLEAPTAPKPAPPATSSLKMPSASVDQAVRSLSHGGGGSANAVGDLSSDLYSSSPIRSAPTGPPRAGVQLKSDPMGVDFKPYLLEVLQAVRRNWFAVMPESARLGQRGQVVLVFGVGKDGKINKVVFSTESGARPLDRAAVAALSMSDPLPPLPSAFKGSSVALQFTFQYNAPPH